MQTQVTLDIDESTIWDLVSCINRELALRERVYPKWVRERRMTQDRAKEELANMLKVQRLLVNIKLQVGPVPPRHPKLLPALEAQSTNG